MTTNESNCGVFHTLNDAAPSQHVMVAYRLSNGAVKVAEMGYVTNGSTSKKDLKQQFKFGCMRVNDNLLTGHSGYVRDADGNIYKVCRESKQAELVNY